MSFQLQDVSQGSAEWLALRKDKIGASEVSIILGCNPWMTPLKLWRQKLGLDPSTVENEAMRKGKELEPTALAEFNKDYECDCIPVVGVNPAFPWLIASLDGWDGKTAVEIKCGGKTLYDQAFRGEVPEYYNIQIQTQMIVFGLFKMQYFVYFEEKNICFEVERDIELCSKIIKESKKFWDMVQNLESPALTDKDYVQRDDDSWASIVDQWKFWKQQKADAEVREKNLKEELIRLSEGQSSQGAGVRISRIVSKGRVDYDQIVKDYMVLDVERYRKEPIESYRIGEIKDT